MGVFHPERGPKLGGRRPPRVLAADQLIGEAADHTNKIRALGARQLLDHALAGPLPLLQEDQEIGHLLTVRPLVELPDDVASDLARGGQDPKEIPPRRWSERVSEASRILPKHRGASVSAPSSRLKEEYLHIAGPPRARQWARAPSPTFSPERTSID
jgi:hypothetical protein